MTPDSTAAWADAIGRYGLPVVVCAILMVIGCTILIPVGHKLLNGMVERLLKGDELTQEKLEHLRGVVIEQGSDLRHIRETQEQHGERLSRVEETVTGLGELIKTRPCVASGNCTLNEVPKPRRQRAAGGAA